VLKVPRIRVFDAFGIVPRHLRGEHVLVNILLPDWQILKHHWLFVIHPELLLLRPSGAIAL
jgi:hypothetical protein